jgi:DNA-binding transcriptional ArsR family regulator
LPEGIVLTRDLVDTSSDAVGSAVSVPVRQKLLLIPPPIRLRGAFLEQLLWYLLAGTRGGFNRIRIIEVLSKRPYNAHQLSEKLKLDYRTMRHHLDVLIKNHVLARPEGEAYGSMYFISGAMKGNMEVFERVKATVAEDYGEILAKDD